MALEVLAVQPRSPGKQVGQSQLRSRVASPVERRASSLIRQVDVQTKLLEDEDGCCLVSLGCNVKHVEAEGVDEEGISSVL